MPSGLPEEQTEHAFVNVLTRGDLSSIRWVCSPLRHVQPTEPGVHLCTVNYASLNFRDIMLATGKLSPDAIPGTDYPLRAQPEQTLQARDWEEGSLIHSIQGPGGSSGLSLHAGRPRGHVGLTTTICPQGNGPPGNVCWAWSSLAGTPVASA